MRQSQQRIHADLVDGHLPSELRPVRAAVPLSVPLEADVTSHLKRIGEHCSRNKTNTTVVALVVVAAEIDSSFDLPVYYLGITAFYIYHR